MAILKIHKISPPGVTKARRRRAEVHEGRKEVFYYVKYMRQVYHLVFLRRIN